MIRNVCGSESAVQKNEVTRNVEKEVVKKENEIITDIEEINGRKGPEPTRYGDWEYKGRAIDF